jgi:RHS repeat-associated protein
MARNVVAISACNSICISLGWRIAKIVDAGGGGETETRYYYVGWRVVEEQDDNGDTLATYVYGHAIDEVITMSRGGADFFYHSDDLGSVFVVTDSDGDEVERYRYDDYGRPAVFVGGSPVAATTIDNPFLFTGRRYDQETEFYHYRTRYLEPATGRFTTRDQIGGWGDPQNLGNGYTYAGNNPASLIDPMGRDGEKAKQTPRKWAKDKPLEWKEFTGQPDAREKASNLHALTAMTWGRNLGKWNVECVKIPVAKCKGATYGAIVREKGKRAKRVDKPCPKDCKECWECTASYPNADVWAEFVGAESWIKVGKKTAKLLAHEQLHLDLAQAGAIKAAKAIRAIKTTGISCKKNSAHNYATRALRSKTSEVYSAEWKAMSDAQNQYDDETDHGRKADKQAAWAKKIGDMPKSLD